MTDSNKTAENRVAETVLEKPIVVKIQGKKYIVPRPTLGTIIEVSALVSEFGETEFSQDFIDAPTEVLRIAKQYRNLPRILATFMVGVKKYKICGFTFTNSRKIRRMERFLENTITPQEMATVLVEIFSSMECAFFLATITSLNKINHLKPTTTSPTASGQQ